MSSSRHFHRTIYVVQMKKLLVFFISQSNLLLSTHQVKFGEGMYGSKCSVTFYVFRKPLFAKIYEVLPYYAHHKYICKIELKKLFETLNFFQRCKLIKISSYSKLHIFCINDNLHASAGNIVVEFLTTT